MRRPPMQVAKPVRAHGVGSSPGAFHGRGPGSETRLGRLVDNEEIRSVWRCLLAVGAPPINVEKIPSGCAVAHGTSCRSRTPSQSCISESLVNFPVWPAARGGHLIDSFVALGPHSLVD